MKFSELNLEGAFQITPEPYRDSRGEFLRMYCHDIFFDHNLNTNWVQQNISKNPYCGTVRGFHFQTGRFAEVKLVSCIRGSVLDLIIDLRPLSQTFGKISSVKLSSSLGNSIYVPKGFGHGYLTLEDNSEVMYLTSQVYFSEAESGVNLLQQDLAPFDPIAVKSISDKDLNLPSFTDFVATIGQDPNWYKAQSNS
jgi:dTDP-4-dehydrorhamnose 3,5-epimerase